MDISKEENKSFTQNRVATQKRISYEILYAEYFVRRFFIQNPHTWHTKEDVLRFLTENGKEIAIGSLRNIFTKLRMLGFLESSRSSFAEYKLLAICATAKYEIHSMAMGSRGRRVLRLDFFAYLETLDWENVSRVHDVRLWVSVGSLGFVDGSWTHYPRKQLYQKMVDVGGLRFVLQARYGKGKSLMVIVRCANNPVAHDLEGLTRLYDLVSQVRSVHCVGVPDIGEWTVVSWHYGKDTVKGGIEGLDFNLTFEDWFGQLCRVYSRHDGAIRAERVENPNRNLNALLQEAAEKEQKQYAAAQDFASAPFVASMVDEIKILRGQVASLAEGRKSPFVDWESVR